MKYEHEAGAIIDCLERYLPVLPLVLSGSQRKKIVSFSQALLETNETMNLTRIASPEEFSIKHVFDSLLCLRIGLLDGKGIDVGTGAGFPGIPLGIVGIGPITLLDSLAKRIAFLDKVRDSLALDQIHTIHARAEDAGQNSQYREQFRWAVARAVAPLPVLLEYISPFVQVGGFAIAMKGPEVKAEIEVSNRAIELLRLELHDQIHVSLPMDMGERNILVYRKTSKLDRQYPRRAGTPSKNPL